MGILKKPKCRFLEPPSRRANNLYGTFFAWSHDRMSEIILDGSLDFLLLRPINTFYSLSFGELDISSLFSLPVAIFIVCFAINKLKIIITGMLFLQMLVYIFLLFNLISLTALFSEGLSDILPFAENLIEFGSRPTKQYKGFISRFINTALPILAALNTPALFILNGKLAFSDIIRLLIVLLILIFSNYLVWTFGIKRYRGTIF